MIRAVLDANVIVSGMVLFRTGRSAPSAILRAWVNDDFDLLISEHIFDEDDWVLSAAVSARADFLVTGDRQLQRLETIGDATLLILTGVRNLTVRHWVSDSRWPNLAHRGARLQHRLSPRPRRFGNDP